MVYTGFDSNGKVWWDDYLLGNDHFIAPRIRQPEAGDIVFHVPRNPDGSLASPLAVPEYRMVINQPLVAFTDDGKFATFNSWQGRFDDRDADMFSHIGAGAHSFDWGNPDVIDGQSVSGDVYVVAPVDSYMVFARNWQPNEAENGLPDKVGSLGNWVTLRAKEELPNGDPVFMTFAHLRHESIPIQPPEMTGQQMTDITSAELFVPAGTIIGKMGDTGWGGTHLHMQVGSCVSQCFRVRHSESTVQ